MAMEFRHLRCFVVLAEELHFGRAARRLAMSQPPLSVNIRQLEEAVGARLFERDSKGVRLTAAGAAFRRPAQALLAKAQEASTLAREIGQGAAGRLRVGFVGSVLYRGLPGWLDDYQRAHPGIQVTLVELNSQEQLDALQHDEIDVGLVHTPRMPEGLVAQRVWSEPFVACLPAEHPAARRRRVALGTLRDEAFVLFSRRVSPDYHARIVAMCEAAGFTPRVRHEVRHWLSVVALVAQGMGVAVVPAPLVRSGLAGAVFKPLDEQPAQSTEVYCVWRPETDHPARQRFVDTVLGTRAADRPLAL